MDTELKLDFFTNIATSIGNIGTLLQNLQMIIDNLPDKKDLYYNIEKIKEVQNSFDKLKELFEKYNQQYKIDKIEDQTLKNTISIFLQILDKYDFDEICKQQQKLQRMFLDNDSELYKTIQILIKFLKDFDQLLYLLEHKNITTNDIVEIVEFVRRTNKFHKIFSGWKKAAVIAIISLFTVAYYSQQIISAIKSTAKYLP